MNDFVREHITRILQPFGEHVEEIRRAVDQLTADLAETDRKANKNGAELSQHLERLNTLRPDVDKVALQATRTQSTLETTIDDQKVMWTDMKATQVKLDATHELADATESFARNTQQQLTETSTVLTLVQAGLAETDSNIVRKINPEIAELRKMHGDIDMRHECTVAKVSQVKEYAEKTDSDFLAYVKAYGLQKQKDDRRFSHVNASLGDFGNMLKDTDHRLHEQTDQLTTTITMIKALRSKLNGTADDLLGVKASCDETAEIVRSSLPDLEYLKQMVRELSEEEGPPDNSGDVQESANIKAQVLKLAQNFDRFKLLVETHEEVIGSWTDKQSAELLRIEGVEEQCTVMQVQLRRLEDNVGVEHPGSGDMTAVNKMVAAIKSYSLTAKHKKVAEKLDSHGGLLGDLDNRVRGTTNELDSTNITLGRTIEALQACTQQVKDLSAAQELTQEYWQGLSMGLRETHKSVALENSLLPPKGFPNMTLPVIPRGDSRPTTATGTRQRPKTPVTGRLACAHSAR